MNHSEVADETLDAYVDGELDAAAVARVEAALARDPALATRVAEQRALRELLQQGFNPVALEPVPDRLLRIAAAVPAPVAEISAARTRRAAASSNARWAWREWGAMAATLVLGLMVGLSYRGRGDEQPLITRDGALLAADFLADALSTQQAGSAADTAAARIGLSIRASNGEYCRSFTVRPATAGLACRRGDAWVVDVVARAADAGQGEFRQAASSLPEAVRTAIEQRMSGEPLTSAEETAGIKAGWQMQPTPAGAP